MPAAVQTSVAPTRTAPQRERKPAPAREAPAAAAMGAPVTHLAEGRVSCACGGGCPRCRRRTTAVPDSVHRALALPGWPIPQPLREQAESFFGTDFAHIRLHADAIAATAAAESRAHAIVSGHHILLSRQRRDLALPAAQRTLAHELTHTLTLQPASVSAGTFESDTAPCETAAVAASRAFTPGAVASPSVAAPSCRARGICREPDPRLDALVQLIEDLPLTLIPSGIAEELHAAAPELDLHDPDNYEPLRLLIDGRFGSGAADEVFSIWLKLREDLSAAPSPPPESSQSELEIQTSGGDDRLQRAWLYRDSTWLHVRPPFYRLQPFRSGSVTLPR